MKQKGLYILLVLGLLLAACTPAATEAATETPQPTCEQAIKIAIIGAMSGTNAVLGDWMKKGVTLAVEEKNAAGGVQGCKIELIIYADEADPTKAVGLAQKVATQDN